MHVKTIIKKTAKWSLLSFSALLLLAALLFGMAQTGPGRKTLGSITGKALSNDPETQVEIGKVGGFIPFKIQIEHMTVIGYGSQWLRLDGISVAWSPLSLLRGKLVVNELRIMSVQVDRPPDYGTEKTVDKRAMPPWLRAIKRLELEKFQVEKIILGTSILEERTAFKLEAGMGISLPDGTWETRINLERLNQSGASTTARAFFQGDETHFSADALVEDPAGGLVARFLGIEGPIHLALKGKGPKTSWKGVLIAEGGSLGKFRANLGLSLHKDIRLSAQGSVQLASAHIPNPLAHWTGQSTLFELRVNIDKKKRLTIDALTLKSENAHLQIKGSLDLEKETTDGQFKLQSEDLSPLEYFVPIKGKGGGTVDGHFSGPLLKPETSINFNLSNLQNDEVHIRDVRGHARFTFINPIGVPPLGVRVRSDGKIGELTFKTGKNPILEKDITWILTVDEFSNKKLHIDRLKLTGKSVSLLLFGWIDTPNHTGGMDLHIDVADLSVYTGSMEDPFAGRIQLQAKIKGNVRDRSFSTRITGKYKPPETYNPSLLSMMGREIGYSGIFTYDGQKEIKGSNLHLETLSGTIGGDVAYHFEDGKLTGAFQMEIPKLDKFSPLLGKRIQGSLSAKGTISGPYYKPTLDSQILGRKIRFEKMNTDRFSAGLKVEGFPPENKGQLDFYLVAGQEKIQGKTDFIMSKKHLHLTRLSVRGADAEISGALSFDLKHLIIEGRIQGVSKDLGPVSALFKQKVKGAAQITLEGSGSKSGQKIAFVVDASDMAFQGILSGKVSFQGEIVNAFKAPEGVLKLLFQNGTYERIRVASLEMYAEGTPGQFHFSGKVKGEGLEDFDLETSGQVSFSAQGRKILFNRFQGRYGKLPLDLVQPVVLSTWTDRLEVDPITLHIGAGQITGSGRIDTETIALSVQIKDLPMAAFPVNLPPDLRGKANGQIQLKGSSGKPEAKARLIVTGLGMHLPQTEALPSGTLEINADLSEGRLMADMTLQSITTVPLKAGLELPITLSLAPFSIAIPEGKAVIGDMTGAVDLSRIAEIYAIHDQVLNGRMAFNLSLGGHWGDLKIRGEGRLEHGSYENVRTGTILKDIEALFEAEDQRIVLQSAQASDGESGKIKAQGWVDIVPAKGFPFMVDLVMDEAKPLRHDDVMVITGGPLRLSGSLKTLLLEGQIQMTKAEIRIPDRLPPGIVQLEVVEIHQRGSKSMVNKDRSPPPGPIQKRDLKLDVSLSSPGQIFVAGRGLSSEWKGNLQVKGTADTPVITGQLSVVRGHVNFLGKRFKLSRGLISFTGAAPPSPQIDVLGESRTKDLTVRIALTGPMKRPAVKLSSDPELPQDEVLSRLLFGRNMASISPFQAIQLASAANTLAGGGGYDLLGQTRKMLGVDQLEIKTPEGDTSETAVSAGKYLSENIYMEVEKGLGPKGGKGSVVWEITPNITVETEVGEDAEIGGGVNWKWDY